MHSSGVFHIAGIVVILLVVLETVPHPTAQLRFKFSCHKKAIIVYIRTSLHFCKGTAGPSANVSKPTLQPLNLQYQVPLPSFNSRYVSTISSMHSGIFTIVTIMDVSRRSTSNQAWFAIAGRRPSGASLRANLPRPKP